MTCMGAGRSSKFSQILPSTALERLKKFQKIYNGKNGVATFSQLFLFGSVSYLQVTMAYMRAWMSLKFGQIQLLVSMATGRVIMEKTMLPLFLGCFYLILFILAGNDDMHESSEEFEIQPDLTTTVELAALERLKKSP